MSSAEGRQVLLATSAAFAAALVTYVVAHAISGDLVVNGRNGPTPVPLGAVAVATLAGGLAVWAIVRFARRTRGPGATFVALIMVGLAVSAVAPVVAATTATTAGGSSMSLSVHPIFDLTSCS